MFRKYLFFSILILSIAIFSINSVAEETEEESTKIPNFTLKDLDGESVEFYELLGEGPIYIDFWATWCVPCKKEMPELQKLYNSYKDDGFLMIAISNDPPKQESEVKRYIKKNKFDFMVLLDQAQEVSQKLGVPKILPYGILVDMDGDIVKKHMGYKKGYEKTLEKEIKLLIDGTEKTPETEAIEEEEK